MTRISKKNRKIRRIEKRARFSYFSGRDINPYILLLVIQKFLLNPDFIDNKERKSSLLNICAESGIDLTSHEITKKETRLFWSYLMRHGILFCDLCGMPITREKDLTYDHKIPQSKGGGTNIENARPTHKLCNGLKGDIIPEEWEKVGEDILKRRGIIIDYSKVGYNYNSGR